MTDGPLHQVVSIGVAVRVEVAGPGGVATVGGHREAPPADLPRQPVVREDDGVRTGRLIRLDPTQPADLRHGHRRHGYGTDRVGPGLAPAELVDQILRVARGPVVVPQQGVAHQVARFVQCDHAVLLPADGQCLHVVQQARVGRCRLVSRPPVLGRHLGARRMGRPRHAQDLPRLGVADGDLHRLRR